MKEREIKDKKMKIEDLYCLETIVDDYFIMAMRIVNQKVDIQKECIIRSKIYELKERYTPEEISLLVEYYGWKYVL
jgi:hypothetical protein